jgi:hypothetical protein
MQGYGVTASYFGGNIDGSVFANNGAPDAASGLGDRRNHNLIFGPNADRSPTGVLTNSFLFHPHALNGTLMEMGFGAGVDVATVTNNYFVGGATLLNVSDVTTATVTGNKVFSTNVFPQYTVIPASSSWTWNSNTYYKSQGISPFGKTGTGLLNFAAWKAATGYDAASSETGTNMPDVTPVVIPNTYVPGMANVIFFAGSNPSSINVNLSTVGLTDGQAYVIKNAFDLRGASVATGVYNAASPTVSVPINGAARNVAAPVGVGYTPATTLPDFGILMIEPSASAAPSSQTASPAAHRLLFSL